MRRVLAGLASLALVLAPAAVGSVAAVAAAATCGVERWNVKTGADPDAGKVNLSQVTASTVAGLGAVPAPAHVPVNNRVAPTETTQFSQYATLTQYKLEDDSDYHLVLSDAAGHHMIAEIPDPACVAASSPFRPGITRARQAFDRQFTATTVFQSANVAVKVAGIGFFDFNHGQTGIAPNGIELHPALDLTFNATRGALVADRRAGPDRYATSAAVSAASYPAGTPVAYIATGQAFPDALAGGAAAATLTGPVLLVTPTAIPTPIQAELRRLTPGRIVVLGGPAAVSDAVLTALQDYTVGAVTRGAGTDRYATASVVSGVFAPDTTAVYVATGQSFPDALAGTAAAAKDGAAILLTTPTALPAATAQALQRLRPPRITILGGTNAVSATVASQLAQYSPTVSRIGGADRYATAAAIAAATFTSATGSYLASGTGFPDALAGGSAAGSSGQPLLLVQPGCVPTAPGAELGRLDPSSITLLGGTAVLTGNIATLTPCEPTVASPPPNPPPSSSTCSASVSDPSPPQHSTEHVLIQTGPGAAVAATAHYKATNTTQTGTAGPDGKADIAFAISRATLGFRVIVDVTTTLHGSAASCSTSFTPRWQTSVRRTPRSVMLYGPA